MKEWCGDHLWAPSCYHGSGWEVVKNNISVHNTYEYNRRYSCKIAVYRPGTFVRGIPVTADDKDLCSQG